MTLDEAAKILEGEAEDYSTRAALRDAHKLGNEALKRYQELRSRNRIPAWETLPGETKAETGS